MATSFSQLLRTTPSDANGRKVPTQQTRTIPVMTDDDDADQSANDHVPLINPNNVSLSDQESELVDGLVGDDEHGTFISANEMARVLVKADISDEHREATVDDLVYVYRSRTGE